MFNKTIILFPKLVLQLIQILCKKKYLLFSFISQTCKFIKYNIYSIKSMNLGKIRFFYNGKPSTQRQQTSSSPDSSSFGKYFVGSNQNNQTSRSHKRLKVVSKDAITLIEVKVELINGRNFTLRNFKPDDSIKDIKLRIVNKNIYTELLTQQTVLEYKGQVVPDRQIIQNVIPSLSKPLKLVQRKAELWEVGGLKVLPNKEDPITCEKGVAKLKCGHEIGRQALKDYVQNTLGNGQNQFCCHHSSKGKRCLRFFTKMEIVLICGYSRSQVIQHDQRLNENWVKKNTKRCPDCQENICIIGLDTRRVCCPKCQNNDFCFDCLESWKGNNNNLCGNDPCFLKRKLVGEGEWTRQFQVNDRQSGEYITVMTPEYRACPRCGNIINNYKACKHTGCTCMNMEPSFCFICLATCENGSWPCGGFQDYCGRVAPNQKMK